MIWMELLGAAAGVLAVVGVLLNNRKRIGCFYVWAVSNSICLVLHVYAAIDAGADTWALAARDAVFLVLVFEGIIHWRKKEKSEPRINTNEHEF